MKHTPLACVAVAAALLSACAGKSFEAQAEEAFIQHFQREMAQDTSQQAQFVRAIGFEVKQFKLHGCTEQGTLRRCGVSFELTSGTNVGEGTKPSPVGPIPVVFSNDGKHWTVLSASF